MPSDSVLNYF